MCPQGRHGSTCLGRRNVKADGSTSSSLQTVSRFRFESLVPHQYLQSLPRRYYRVVTYMHSLSIRSLTTHMEPNSGAGASQAGDVEMGGATGPSRPAKGPVEPRDDREQLESSEPDNDESDNEELSQPADSPEPQQDHLLDHLTEEEQIALAMKRSMLDQGGSGEARPVTLDELVELRTTNRIAAGGRTRLGPRDEDEDENDDEDDEDDGDDEDDDDDDEVDFVMDRPTGRAVEIKEGESGSEEGDEGESPAVKEYRAYMRLADFVEENPIPTPRLTSMEHYNRIMYDSYRHMVGLPPLNRNNNSKSAPEGGKPAPKGDKPALESSKPAPESSKPAPKTTNKRSHSTSTAISTASQDE